MIHNDILRRLRYALEIDNNEAITLFKQVNFDCDLDYLQSIMKKEDDTGFLHCSDQVMSLFLDALIIKYRGKQEGKKPIVLDKSQRISNNEILKKLRIALTLRDEGIIEIMGLAEFRVSKGEISALFRKPGHRNFKPCGDQFLRNFILGMTTKYRVNGDSL